MEYRNYLINYTIKALADVNAKSTETATSLDEANQQLIQFYRQQGFVIVITSTEELPL